MLPNQFIPKFDHYLKAKGLSFEAVIIGATALNLLGIVTRETMDCDVLDPMIPKPIMEASKEFASLEQIPEDALKDNWLNNGPVSLVKDLPSGWRTRVVPLYKGASLNLFTLGRLDLLRSKLFAMCDRGTDLLDCIAMAPTIEELKQCYEWVSERDANPGWPNHVNSNFKKLAGKLGYEF